MKLSIMQIFFGSIQFYKAHFKTFWKQFWFPMVLMAVGEFLNEFISVLLDIAAYVLMVRNMIAFMDTGTFSCSIWQWGKRDFSFLLRYSVLLLLSLLIGSVAGTVIIITGYEEFLINPTLLMTLLLGTLILLVTYFFTVPFICTYHIYLFSTYHKPLKLKEAFTLAKGNNLKFGFALSLYYTAIIILTMNPSFGGKIISSIIDPLLTLHMIIFCTSVFLSLVNRKDYYEK